MLCPMQRLVLSTSALGLLLSTQTPVIAQIPVSESLLEAREIKGQSPPQVFGPNEGLVNGPMPSPESVDLAISAYILGPGDLLDLKILSAPELSGSLPILSDGSVSLPLFGSVRLAGLTIQQASAWIQSLLAKELLNPDVQLSVTTPRPLQISLIGQVQRPGLYTIKSGEASSVQASASGLNSGSSSLPTLVTAIQTAGGITQAADLTNVILQRKVPGLQPRYKKTQINLYTLLFDGDQSQNPYLFDGDVIKVLKAEETSEQVTQIGSTNINPQGITVQVVGEVVTPGVIRMPANTPLNKAILMAGNADNLRANRSNIELYRLNRDGSVSLQRFPLNLSADVSEANNPPLRDGDIVRVRRNLVAKGSDLINGVTQPLTGLVSAWGLVQLVQDQNSR
jgi:polysaccharide export outer membrane protein